MSTPFNFFGDLEGASSLLNEGEKKIKIAWQNGNNLSEDDIDHLENQYRVIRAQLSRIKDTKDKFKAVNIFRAERSK
jgi:hypothetical protein